LLLANYTYRNEKCEFLDVCKIKITRDMRGKKWVNLNMTLQCAEQRSSSSQYKRWNKWQWKVRWIKKSHICVSSSGTGMETKKNLKVKKIFYSSRNEKEFFSVADVACFVTILMNFIKRICFMNFWVSSLTSKFLKLFNIEPPS